MRISGLAVRETVWDKPIAAANYRIEAKDSGAPTGASASAYIDAQNGAANFQLPWTAANNTSAYTRRTLESMDPTGANPLAQLYPIRRDSDALYKAAVYIRTDFGGGTGDDEGIAVIVANGTKLSQRLSRILLKVSELPNAEFHNLAQFVIVPVSPDALQYWNVAQ